MHVEHDVDSLRLRPRDDLRDPVYIELVDPAGIGFEEAPGKVEPDHVVTERTHLTKVELAENDPLDGHVVRRARAAGVGGRVRRIRCPQVVAEVVDDPIDVHSF